ncbi:hypothetical protein ZWY2020_040134 [Hordeum vulgare]|nr:hypothetical protein ZWY2020_040134 [Hordeum vulgare]
MTRRSHRASPPFPRIMTPTRSAASPRRCSTCTPSGAAACLPPPAPPPRLPCHPPEAPASPALAPTNGSVAGSSAPPRSPRDPAPTGPSRPPRPPPRPPHLGPTPPPPPLHPGRIQSRSLPPPRSRSGTPSAPPRSSSPGAAPRTRTATTRMSTGNLSETCNKQTPGGRQAILGTSGACDGGQGDDRDGGVAVISICNPPVNSLSIDVLLSLKESYEEALERKDVKAIVVTGKGGKISGGFDISSFGGLHSGKIEQPKVGATKPSAAAIDGLCLGGGLEVSMACHAGISTPTSQLGLPELQLGIIPGFGATSGERKILTPWVMQILSAYFLVLPLRVEGAISLGLGALPGLFAGSLMLTALAAPVASLAFSLPSVPKSKALVLIHRFFSISLLVFFMLWFASKPGSPATAQSSEDGLNKPAGWGNHSWFYIGVRISFFLWVALLNLITISSTWARVIDVMDSEVQDCLVLLGLVLR